MMQFTEFKLPWAPFKSVQACSRNSAIAASGTTATGQRFRIRASLAASWCLHCKSDKHGTRHSMVSIKDFKQGESLCHSQGAEAARRVLLLPMLQQTPECERHAMLTSHICVDTVPRSWSGSLNLVGTATRVTSAIT
eukprot:GHRR01030597.1.p1 GENE.GHRR01030597.1~~GHRR01030597.1.p1  ORF type:complete len:137 (-),score=25.35 GHRR01030597.1:921-1331(-)